MKKYLTASCNLPRIVRDCLNGMFSSIDTHILTHRRRHTVAVGGGNFETRYGGLSFMGLDFTVEDADGKECDYFGKEYIDEDIFIVINCGCGEEFIIATSIFGYGINPVNYIELVESYVENVNNRYNRKEAKNCEVVENKESKNPLYGLDP